MSKTSKNKLYKTALGSFYQLLAKHELYDLISIQPTYGRKHRLPCMFFCFGDYDVKIMLTKNNDNDSSCKVHGVLVEYRPSNKPNLIALSNMKKVGTFFKETFELRFTDDENYFTYKTSLDTNIKANEDIDIKKIFNFFQRV